MTQIEEKLVEYIDDAYEILPGHDAWVVGNEPAVAFEFDSSTAATYAKK